MARGLFWGCGALALSGCGPSELDVDEASAEIEVVQVTTLTTVQASSGSFLSASPRKDVPAYVELGPAPSATADVAGLDRAEVDLALLFETTSVEALPELHASLRPAGDGEWSAIETHFPEVAPAPGGVDWPIALRREAPTAPAGVSSEWSGWQAYGGLGVRSPARAQSSGAVTAAVATLEFEVRGAPSPLVLTGDVDDLVVTNRSGAVIERALLIYSHAGGVGVTLVEELGPGASAVTGLGPKEHPPERLLELARADLREFFIASVGEELGVAIADAKSIPFLETRGLRLISMLQDSEAPATLEFDAKTSRRQVVVSHSEILKPDAEALALDVVADLSLDAEQVGAELGRFSEAKLEYVALNGDDQLRARAEALRGELRRR